MVALVGFVVCTYSGECRAKLFPTEMLKAGLLETESPGS